MERSLKNKNGKTAKSTTRKSKKMKSNSSSISKSSKKKSLKVADDETNKSSRTLKLPKHFEKNDGEQSNNAAREWDESRTAATPTPSLPLSELPDQNEMLHSINKEIKILKLEAKRLFDDLEAYKKGKDGAAKEILEVKRQLQLEKLKGNELVKIRHLLRLGFDETIMKEHLEATNKELRQEMKQKQRDVDNLGANVKKMLTMSKESERAVSAAHSALGPLVVKQQTMQAKLEQAEVELYAIQTKVEHRRNMKSVEITSKDKFKTTMKEIVRKLQIRCRDQELLHDVLQKVGRSLKEDLSLSPVKREVSNGWMKDSEVVVDQNTSTISNPCRDIDIMPGSSGESERSEREDESDSISVSSCASSCASSVDVSSVESW